MTLSRRPFSGHGNRNSAAYQIAFGRVAIALVLVPVAAAFMSSGCANAPAGTGTGPRLVVTLRFRDNVNPIYYYYVVIRNAPDSEKLSPRNWPVPVIAAGAGNGFATDAKLDSGTAAFTDFVLYGGGGQPTTSGFGVYHVIGYLHGKPNLSTSFQPTGEPDSATPPSSSEAKTLSFELSLDRLRALPGECNTSIAGDCPTAKYLNINIIATTKLQIDPMNTDPDKFTDAIGDQIPGSPSFNGVVTVDTTKVSQIYQSSTNPGDQYYEPDNDTYPSRTDGGIELLAWQILVKQ